VILGLILLVPLFPPESSLLTPLEALGTSWQVIAVAFTAILLTGLLYNLNGTIIRVYRGDGWRNVWFGRLPTKRYMRLLDTALGQQTAYRSALSEMARQNRFDEDFDKVWEQQSAITRRISREFPTRFDMLPTRLGNVIRSF
jgi:hypothetical protein